MPDRVLLDTNILIRHLAESPNPPAPSSAAISVLTVFEVLRYSGMTPTEEHALHILIEACEILPVYHTIAQRAAELGRTRSTKAIDLLIAATAIDYGIPLITKNIRDFKDIPGLDLQEHF